MVALKMLGLTILAALAISIGALGYTFMQRVSDEQRARNAALEVERAARAAIASGTPQTVRVTIPSNYLMQFVGNQIAVDNWLTPKEGLALYFAENSPEVGAGKHLLALRLEKLKIVVDVL